MRQPKGKKCHDLRDRFIDCMFTHSNLVSERGGTIGEAMVAENERDNPSQCRKIYKYYKICLLELVVNTKARLRRSPLDDIAFDDEGNLILLHQPPPNDDHPQ